MWPTPNAWPPPGTPWLVSVEAYHRMIQADILGEEDPVELLEGRIVYKARQSPQQACAIGLTHECLRDILSSGWSVRIRSGATLGDSEPEPDIVVSKCEPRAFMDHHPGPEEIRLIVEVADRALVMCQVEKVRIYARAAIPCFWIVNLIDHQLEVYTDPSGPDPAPAYRQRQDFRPGDAVPLVLGGQTIGNINVQDLFP